MTKIKNLIQKNERENFPFKPTKSFYQAIKISQKRWGQIYRGETSPTVDELKSIANYFGVEITELI